MPREISCFSLLMPRTTTSISSPMLTSSLGWLIRLVQRHLADVDQALDALFELDEGPVAHDVDHLALDAACRPGTSRSTFSHGLADLLLEAQGDLFLLVVDVQDLHFDFLVDLDHFARDG